MKKHQTNRFPSGLLSKEASSTFGEVLSPTTIAKNSIDIFIPNEFWEKDSTWVDLECGHGELLDCIRKKFVNAGHDDNKVISKMIFGADIQEKSVIESIKRFYGQESVVTEQIIPPNWKSTGLLKMFAVNGKNIFNFVQANSLEWKASFGKKIIQKLDNPLFWIED